MCLFCQCSLFSPKIKISDSMVRKKNLLVKDSNFDLDETTRIWNLLSQGLSQSLTHSSQSLCNEYRLYFTLIPLLWKISRLLADCLLALFWKRDRWNHHMRCFTQFSTICTKKPREKHPRMSVTILKATLLHGCFSRFLIVQMVQNRAKHLILRYLLIYW